MSMAVASPGTSRRMTIAPAKAYDPTRSETFARLTRWVSPQIYHCDIRWSELDEAVEALLVEELATPHEHRGMYGAAFRTGVSSLRVRRAFQVTPRPEDVEFTASWMTAVVLTSDVAGLFDRLADWLVTELDVFMSTLVEREAFEVVERLWVACGQGLAYEMLLSDVLALGA
jgi:hypothetical protein